MEQGHSGEADGRLAGQEIYLLFMELENELACLYEASANCYRFCKSVLIL
jgi:hypothetical protein